MALEQITFNLGALDDAANSGKNYVAGQVFEVFNIDDTYADIFADSAGTIPIDQSGIQNISNSDGECKFFIDKGFYNIKSGGKARQLNANFSFEFETVSDAVNAKFISLLEGRRVFIAERGAYFNVVLTSSLSGNGDGIDELTSVSNPLYGLEIENESIIYIDKLGAGTADDASIINRAQDLADGKPIIYSANKTYTASQITIKGRSFHLSSNFFSAENGTYTKPRLKRADGTNVDFFKYESLNDEPFFMVGLQLDGNKDNNTDGSGLVVSNQRSMIKECGIHNFNKDGITIEDNGSALVEIRIQNNMISYNGRDGIRNNGTNSTDHHIVENEIFRNDGRGIYSLFNTFNWAVRLNHLYANGLESIRAEDCIRTKIQNNKSDNVGRLATYNISGIYISTNNGFTGNQIQNNESSGGKFISSTAYEFTGIECSVTGSALNQISNNTIVGMIDPNLTTFYPSRSTALKITGSGVMQGSVYDNDVLQCDTIEDFNSEFTLSYNNRLVQNSGSTSTNQRKPTSNFESFTYNKDRTNGTKRLIEYGDYTTPPTTGTWNRNDIVYYKEPVRGGKIGAICYSTGSPGSWGEFGQVGYRESASTPSGSITPRFIGEEYFKNDTGDWFKSTGLTNTDWKQIT